MDQVVGLVEVRLAEQVAVVLVVQAVHVALAMRVGLVGMRLADLVLQQPVNNRLDR